LRACRTFFSGKHGVQRFLAYGTISGVQTVNTHARTHAHARTRTYTHVVQVVLAFRGTAGLKDVLADATATQARSLASRGQLVGEIS
jgi:hypothetical protein